MSHGVLGGTPEEKMTLGDSWRNADKWGHYCFSKHDANRGHVGYMGMLHAFLTVIVQIYNCSKIQRSVLRAPLPPPHLLSQETVVH